MYRYVCMFFGTEVLEMAPGLEKRGDKFCRLQRVVLEPSVRCCYLHSLQSHYALCRNQSVKYVSKFDRVLYLWGVFVLPIPTIRNSRNTRIILRFALGMVGLLFEGNYPVHRFTPFIGSIRIFEANHPVHRFN